MLEDREARREQYLYWYSTCPAHGINYYIGWLWLTQSKQNQDKKKQSIVLSHKGNSN